MGPFPQPVGGMTVNADCFCCDCLRELDIPTEDTSPIYNCRDKTYCDRCLHQFTGPYTVGEDRP